MGEIVDVATFQRCSKMYEWKIGNSHSRGRIPATITVFQINVRGLKLIKRYQCISVLSPSNLNKI